MAAEAEAEPEDEDEEGEEEVKEVAGGGRRNAKVSDFFTVF